jgi:hypothetical protein
MNFYLNYFKQKIMATEDNPPVGVILCSDKDQTKVQFATAGLIIGSSFRVISRWAPPRSRPSGCLYRRDHIRRSCRRLESDRRCAEIGGDRDCRQRPFRGRSSRNQLFPALEVKIPPGLRDKVCRCGDEQTAVAARWRFSGRLGDPHTNTAPGRRPLRESKTGILKTVLARSANQLATNVGIQCARFYDR